jgi:hypothetical protein
MPHPMVRPEPLVLPPEPDPEKLPRYADRQTLARIHTFYFGPESPRTLEAWPLMWRRVNGRAVSEVRAFLAEAQRRFDAAPVLMGGRRIGAGQRGRAEG